MEEKRLPDGQEITLIKMPLYNNSWTDLVAVLFFIETAKIQMRIMGRQQFWKAKNKVEWTLILRYKLTSQNLVNTCIDISNFDDVCTTT